MKIVLELKRRLNTVLLQQHTEASSPRFADEANDDLPQLRLLWIA